MFLLLYGRHARGTTWRLLTKLYKFRQNCLPDNAAMKIRTDLNLGDVFCPSIIYHIPDSWFNLLNGLLHGWFLFSMQTTNIEHITRWREDMNFIVCIACNIVCKPSTSSRVGITVSNSPNPSCVYIRLYKHGKPPVFYCSKEQCHEGFVVLAQFCAKIINLRL